MRKLDLKGLGWFVGLAFAFSWALSLPVTLGERGVETPGARWVLAAMMFGPAAAAFVVARWVSPLPDLRASTGLRLRAPGRPVLSYWAVAWVGPPLLVALALVLSWALGLMELDLVHFSGLREAIEKAPGGQVALANVSPRTIALVQLPLLLLAPILNALPSFGEEYGWRGYLLPRLLPLGQWRALLLSGLIWGVWHAPVIARGYNYPGYPVLGVLAMTVFCVLQGVLFGWLRLATGSVWPAVIAHGALNGSAGLAQLVGKAGSPVNTLHATLLGWSGWLLLGGVVALLVALRRLPVRDAPDEAELPQPAAG